jgi:hypothetical protein
MDNKKTIDNDKRYKNYFFDVINSLSTNSKCIKHMKLNLIYELNRFGPKGLRDAIGSILGF